MTKETRDDIEDFTRMVLWQKAQALAADTAGVISRLPRTRDADVLGTQLLRSAGSVPANIAEGYGRFSRAAYRNHLSIARGSLFETISWLDLLNRCGYLGEEQRAQLVDECRSIGRLLTTRMKSLSEGSPPSIREEGPSYDAEL